MDQYIIDPKQVKEFLKTRAYNWNGNITLEDYTSKVATSEDFHDEELLLEIETAFNTARLLSVNISNTKFLINHYERGFENLGYTNDHSVYWRTYLLETDKKYKKFLHNWATKRREELIDERNAKKEKIDEQYKYEIDEMERLIESISEEETKSL